MKYGLKIKVTHVSGKRMQAQGTDDVSRGSLKAGVSIGEQMIKYCPWGRGPIEVEPQLKFWVKTWAGETLSFSPQKIGF